MFRCHSLCHFAYAKFCQMPTESAAFGAAKSIKSRLPAVIVLLIRMWHSTWCILLLVCWDLTRCLPAQSSNLQPSKFIEQVSIVKKKVVKSSPRWLVKGLTTELDARTAPNWRLNGRQRKGPSSNEFQKPRFMFLTEDGFARGKMSKCSDTSNREADRIRQCAFTTYQTFFFAVFQRKEPAVKGSSSSARARPSRLQVQRDQRASLSSYRESPPFPFLLCKCFSSHKFLFLKYHNLYIQFWCIISIYRFCRIIFKYNFYSRKTYAYNLYAQLIKK
jgi:hypothetical protein